MKVYTGWVLLINSTEHTIIGSCTMRKQTSYILRDNNDKKVSIRREVLLAVMHDGTIKYVR